MRVRRSASATFRRNIFGAVLIYELVSIINNVRAFPGIPTDRMAP